MGKLRACTVRTKPCSHLDENDKLNESCILTKTNKIRLGFIFL